MASNPSEGVTALNVDEEALVEEPGRTEGMTVARATEGAFCQKASFMTRVWQKLGFFAHYDEPLFDWRQDVPKGGDLITTDTTVTLTWGDRWRVLFSGRFSVTAWTKTWVEVGKTETRSQFCALPPVSADARSHEALTRTAED